MKIDFNNVRRRAIHEYNAIVDELNRHLDKQGERVDSFWASDIRVSLDGLRSCLVGIGCTYENGNDEFKCILDDDLRVAEFQPEDDNE